MAALPESAEARRGGARPWLAAALALAVGLAPGSVSGQEGRPAEPETLPWIEAQPAVAPDGERVPPIPVMRVFSGHSDAVLSVAAGPGGKVLASGSGDGSVRLWDAASGRELRKMSGHHRGVNAVAFSPGGGTLASASFDHSVRLWEVATGEERRVLSGASSGLTSLSFSPDGRTLAAGAADGKLWLWEVSTGRLLRSISADSRSLYSVGFSPDGERLVSGAEGGAVKLWDPATGGVIASLEGHSKAVFSVLFSPGGETLASGSEDGTVLLREMPAGRVRASLAGHSGPVNSVSYSPEGKTLASASDDGTVRLWEVATGRELGSFSCRGGAVASVSFGASGGFLVAGCTDGVVRLWPLAEGNELRTASGHTESLTHLAFAPDGRTLATASADRTVRLWDVATGKSLFTLVGHSEEVNSVAFSPDGRTLASGSDDKTIRLWNPATGRSTSTLAEHSGAVGPVAFAPDGKILASGSADRTIRLWNPAAGRSTSTLSGHSGAVSSVAFDPEGRTLASGAEDGTRLWEVATSEELRSLGEAGSHVGAVAFSPDGERLATYSREDDVVLWDPATGEKLAALEPAMAISVSAMLGFSPDGGILSLVFSRLGFGKSWDVATGEELAGSRLLHRRGIGFLSPDGRMAATVALGLAFRMSSVPSGRELRTVGRPWRAVASVGFCAEGGALASRSEGGAVRLWEIPTGRLLRFLPGDPDLRTRSYLSPDAGILATSRRDEHLRLWDAATGDELATGVKLPDVIRDMTLSRDGKTVAFGDLGSHAQVWDVTTGDQLLSVTARTARNYPWLVSLRLRLDQTGKTLAAWRSGKGIQLWDIASGREIQVHEKLSKAVTAAAFGADGNTLAAGFDDGAVRLSDVASSRLLATLSGHSDDVNALRFSPGGEVLASGAEDGTVRLWDVPAQAALGTLSGHSGAVLSLSFSANGETLASGSRDGTIRLWDTASGACRVVLLGYPGGGWAAWHADGHLLRGDGGRHLAVRRGWGEPFETLLPPRPEAGTADLAWEPPARVDLADGLAAEEPVVLRIRNEGDAPAFWVRLDPELPSQDGFVAAAPAFRSRLDPGEVAEIPVEITYLHVPPKEDPKLSPRPLEGKVRLTLTSAFTDPRTVEIPVRVDTPSPRVEGLRVLPDPDTGEPSAVELRISNAGTLNDSAGLRVALELVDDATGALRARVPAKAAEDQRVPGLPPGVVSGPLTFAIPDELRGELPRLRARVTMVGGIWPTHRWRSEHDLETGVAWALPAALALAVILALLAVGYQLVFRHPLVLELAAEPKGLLRIPLLQTPQADKRLRRARRLEGVLQGSSVTAAHWSAALDGARHPAEALSTAIGASLGEGEDLAKPEPGRAPRLVAHGLVLPEAFPLRVEPATALVLYRGGLARNLRAVLGDLVHDRKLSGAYLLVLDLSPKQDAAERLSGALFKHTVISERRLTSVLLDDRPREALAACISENADLGDISPYQTGGGVENPSFFFGRQQEQALLAGRDARNHLLIGPRQMGKTSVLKDFQRRDPERVHLIGLVGADLDGALAKAKLPPLDELVDALPPDRVTVLLLDEADDLVAADRERGYPLLRELRALADEHPVRFVLAGFWELHHAAYLEHHSPIRNFAEPIPLGPLDEKAARELATVPMEPLGIRWASEEVLAELLERTGRRPNLVSLACDACIRALDPLGGREITAEMLRAVLDLTDDSGRDVASSFASLFALSGKEHRANALDRMLLFAAVDLPSFSSEELRARLAAAGADVPVHELRLSLDRLSLAYAVLRTAGRYAWPVPLVRDFLLDKAEGDPEEALRLEARAWAEL